MLRITKEGSCWLVSRWIDFGGKDRLGLFFFCAALYLLSLATWQHPQGKHVCRFCNLGFHLIWFPLFSYLVSWKKEIERQNWERKKGEGVMWWSLKWLPAVQKVHTPKRRILVSFGSAKHCGKYRKGVGKAVWRWEKEKEMKDKTYGCIKTRTRECEGEGGRRRERERYDYVDCLPHPLLALFFSPATSSSSIILPRSIASRHKTELPSTALCNTTPPVPRKCCAPLEQRLSFCTNRNTPMKQASEQLVFNPIVQDSRHTTHSSCRWAATERGR